MHGTHARVIKSRGEHRHPHTPSQPMDQPHYGPVATTTIMATDPTTHIPTTFPTTIHTPLSRVTSDLAASTTSAPPRRDEHVANTTAPPLPPSQPLSRVTNDLAALESEMADLQSSLLSHVSRQTFGAV